MCMGENAGDTFKPAEMSFLRDATAQRLPGYRSLARDSGHIAWMVLEPETFGALPRFTICGMDPCMVVQIEEAEARRFISVASLDDALVIAQRAVCETNARRNVHFAPAMAQ